MPHKATDLLRRLGTFIKWTTNDPAVLATMHDAIVRLVVEVGISGLFEIANCVKMTEQVVGRLGIDWRGAIDERSKKALSPQCQMMSSDISKDSLDLSGFSRPTLIGGK